MEPEIIISEFEYSLINELSRKLGENRANLIKLQEEQFQLLKENEEIKINISKNNADIYTKYNIPGSSKIEVTPERKVIIK